MMSHQPQQQHHPSSQSKESRPTHPRQEFPYCPGTPDARALELRHSDLFYEVLVHNVSHSDLILTFSVQGPPVAADKDHGSGEEEEDDGRTEGKNPDNERNDAAEASPEMGNQKNPKNPSHEEDEAETENEETEEERFRRLCPLIGRPKFNRFDTVSNALLKALRESVPRIFFF